eukprot:4110802-Pyramimonas_sp.AAC.1
MEQPVPGGYATEQTPGLTERLRRMQEQQEAAMAPPKANSPAHASTHVSGGMEQQTTGGYEAEQTPGRVDRLRRKKEQEEAEKAAADGQQRPALGSPRSG